MFIELIHENIKKETDMWMSPQLYNCYFIVTYDIDYDVTKIRFWRQEGTQVITKRWIMPSFKSVYELDMWLEAKLEIFRTVDPDTYIPETPKGYIKYDR